jgi:succinate dehydrogenase hydrophobic anchor subunit
MAKVQTGRVVGFGVLLSGFFAGALSLVPKSYEYITILVSGVIFALCVAPLFYFRHHTLSEKQKARVQISQARQGYT